MVQINSEGESRVEVLADYLVTQMTGGTFGIEAERFAELANSVEPEFGQHIERWMRTYLGWLFIHAVRRRRGDEFAEALLQSAYHTDRGGHQNRSAIEAMQFWFPRFDRLEQEPRNVGDLGNVPFGVRITLAFVSTADSASPYYNKPDTPTTKLVKVAQVIDRAPIAAAPAMRAMIGPEVELDERIYLAERSAAIDRLKGQRGSWICGIIVFGVVALALKAFGLETDLPILGGLIAGFGSALLYRRLVDVRLSRVSCPYCRGRIPVGRLPGLFGRPEPWKKCPICAHELPQDRR